MLSFAGRSIGKMAFARWQSETFFTSSMWSAAGVCSFVFGRNKRICSRNKSFYYFPSALIPGKVPLAKNSSIAPPAVETKKNLFRGILAFLTAATVSPPPIIDFVFDLTIILAYSKVPLSKPFFV